MASLSSFSCSRCRGQYWSEWHMVGTNRAPDINICDKCIQKDKDAKVAALKAELAMIARSPVLMLLAEVSVLRDTLVSSGRIDEVQHFKKVIEAAKQFTSATERQPRRRGPGEDPGDDQMWVPAGKLVQRDHG